MDTSVVIIEWLRNILMPRNHGMTTVVTAIGPGNPRFGYYHGDGPYINGDAPTLRADYFALYLGQSPFMLLEFGDGYVRMRATYPPDLVSRLVRFEDRAVTFTPVSGALRLLPSNPRKRMEAINQLPDPGHVFDRIKIPETIFDLQVPDSLQRLSSYINTVINTVRGSVVNGTKGVVLRTGIELTDLAERATREYESKTRRMCHGQETLPGLPR